MKDLEWLLYKDIESYREIVIHLSLEVFQNAGLTPDECEALINSVLYSKGVITKAKPSRINNNFYITLPHSSSITCHYIVEDIQRELYSGLVRKLKDKNHEDSERNSGVAGL